MKKPVKKVVLAALAAAVSFVACAGGLYWQASDIKASSSKPLTGANQYRAYLFATSITPAGAAMTYGNTPTTIEEIETLLTTEGTTTADLEKYATMNHTVCSYLNTDYSAETKTASFASTYFGVAGKNAVLSIFGIVLDAATFESAANYMLLTGTDGEAISQKSLSTLNGEIDTTWDFGSQANNTWIAIPEPTSGLLLVLGMASLALRRRTASH